MVANILPMDTPSTPELVSKGQTISFSESSHVAYHIKGNYCAVYCVNYSLLPLDLGTLASRDGDIYQLVGATGSLDNLS